MAMAHTATVLVPIATAKPATMLALPSRVITTDKLLTNTIEIGIKASKDDGISAVTTGNGTKPKVISGIKEDRVIGTRKTTARVGAAIAVMSTGRALMAGNGAAQGTS